MGILADVERVLSLEIEALQQMRNRLDESVVQAVSLLLGVKGRVIFTGMGKAGHVARKLAATFSSTGTPAIFMHPGEAYHGDLGIVNRNDIAIILSNSGETEEVVKLVPCLKRFNVSVIALTGNLKSSLAKGSDIVLDTGVEREACPLNCAPTSSTTTAMAMGDALACALITARGFKKEDFAVFHPGGSLGSQLLLRVFELMMPAEDAPIVSPSESIQNAIVAMSSGRVGAVFVLNEEKRLEGVFTDGDLRRMLERGDVDLKESISKVMSLNPTSVDSDQLAAEAMGLMEEKKISVLPVIDEKKCLAGVLQIHMLLEAGIA
ncbi:MAG: KpsF/GutQ family sugar-phosphate isomerase [Desulfovibrio sp.]